MPYFESPYLIKKAGRPNDLWFVSIKAPKTVVKVNGQWRSVMSPHEDFLAGCTVVLRGGYVHEISEALADELTAAGYGDNIVEG